MTVGAAQQRPRAAGGDDPRAETAAPDLGGERGKRRGGAHGEAAAPQPHREADLAGARERAGGALQRREPARRVDGLADGGAGIAGGQGRRRWSRKRDDRQRRPVVIARLGRPLDRRGRAEHPLDVAGREPAEVEAVHLGQRRHRAVERAVEALERPLAVRGGAVRLDAEAALERFEQLAPALHPARHAHADPRDPTAGRDQAELGIVGGDAVGLAQGHAQVLGDGGQRLGRYPALRVLDGV